MSWICYATGGRGVSVTTLIKIEHKGQMTLPRRLRSAIRIREGDVVEATIERGKIVLTPKLPIDHSKFLAADDDYTPAQRRYVDARLAKSDADIRAGRVSKAYSDVRKFLADLHRDAAKPARKTKRPIR